jgi:hypothetical protein
MQNSIADWLFNVMLLGGIVALVVLTVHVFVTPILGAVSLLAGLILVLVVSVFWPQW